MEEEEAQFGFLCACFPDVDKDMIREAIAHCQNTAEALDYVLAFRPDAEYELEFKEEPELDEKPARIFNALCESFGSVPRETLRQVVLAYPDETFDMLADSIRDQLHNDTALFGEQEDAYVHSNELVSFRNDAGLCDKMPGEAVLGCPRFGESFANEPKDSINKFLWEYAGGDHEALVRILKEQHAYDWQDSRPKTAKRRSKHNRVDLEEREAPPKTFTSARSFAEASVGQSSKTTASRRSGHAAFMYTFGTTTDETTDGMTSSELRQAASALQARRLEYLRRACSAYDAGGLTGRGQATYLSQEARRLVPKIAKLNRTAAYIAFRQCNQDLALNSIDLHGLFVNEALEVLEAFLEFRRPATLRLGAEWPELRVITGTGKHSENGARLNPAITLYLRGHRWSFAIESPGVFVLYGLKK